jgi:UDP-GlcNAc:undecaprenyl-phosphate GlcNAc-1-phosphate transferase
VIRLRSGRSPFAADKNHFSHRLVDLGLTPAQAVLTVYLATAACGLAALLLHRVDTMGAVLLVLLVACLLGLIAILETTARRTIRG